MTYIHIYRQKSYRLHFYYFDVLHCNMTYEGPIYNTTINTDSHVEILEQLL